MKRWAVFAVSALSAAIMPAAAWSAHTDPDQLAVIRVQDLHYGDVLFEFYAGNEFEALTRLEAYEQWGRMPHHEADAALLAGGLYLSLGMHNEAGRRFEALLTPSVPAAVRNRAWFYLAKIWYERGYYDRTEQALGRIDGQLAGDLEAEREQLLVNALMHQGRFDEAVTRLSDWHGAPDWMLFARFNLGVALAREGKLAQADPYLTAVGTADVHNPELLALKDKANLALGFAYLQADKPAAAKLPLDRVRLDGPYSSRALLGAGWASAALGQYRAALAPWLELQHRNLLDAAVQEAYLAVPYAYAKLNAAAQAADNYESALKAFDVESGNLDAAILHIRGGHMLDDLLGKDQSAQYGWFWQLKTLPDAPQSRYLYSILADNDFQEGLKNYRDLGYLQGTLTHWGESMEAFGAMIDTREQAYGQEVPRTDALLASDAPTKMRAARAAIDSRLTAIETGNDVAALGSSKQRDQWARIAALEDALASAPPGAERDEARDKLRLIKGALYWQLEQDFKSRSYEQHQALRELDAALNEAQNRWARVQRARAIVPNNTGEFAARIAALGARIDALRARLRDSRAQQSGYLDSVAIAALTAQKDRLTSYAVQARFALADIYDRASDAAPPPATGGPASAPAPAAAGEAPQRP